VTHSVAMASHGTDPIAFVVPLHLVAFFLVAMVCHGRLAQDRPDAASLTEFYLWISAGGALGGAFNALVAPLVFSSVAEYPIVLTLSCLLLPWSKTEPWKSRARLLDFVLPAGLASQSLVLGLQAFGMEPGSVTASLMFGLPVLVSFSRSSNRYFDLEPVLGNLAPDAGLPCIARTDTTLSEEELASGKTGSIWVLVALTPSAVPPGLDRWRPARGRPDLGVWTDSHASALSVLRWHPSVGETAVGRFDPVPAAPRSDRESVRP
jgi:hypothetical protein